MSRWEKGKGVSLGAASDQKFFTDQHFRTFLYYHFFEDGMYHLGGRPVSQPNVLFSHILREGRLSSYIITGNCEQSKNVIPPGKQISQHFFGH
jgi:hypothetical protein